MTRRPDSLQVLDGRAVPEPDPGVGRRGGQCPGDRGDAADRVPDAGADVELRDDGVRGDGAERRDARVERLEAEQPTQPVVGEVPPDVPGQPAEPAAPGEGDQLGAEQIERGVEIAVDERAELEAVELGEVGEVAAQRDGLGRPAEGGDLSGERVGIGEDVQVRAVGELRAVGRRQGQERQPLLELLADRAERVGQDLGGGEHRRAGVEGVPRPLHPPGPPARALAALDHGHLAAGAAQPQRRGEPGEAGADDDDAVGATGNRAHAQAVRVVAATASASRAARASRCERGLGDGRPGTGGLLADPLLDAGPGTRALEQPAQRVELLGAGVRIAQQPVQQRPPGVVGPLLGQRDEQGLLALAQVVVGGLAGDGRVAEDAQDVVAQLERLAQRQPDGRCRPRTPRGRRRRWPRRAAAAAGPCSRRSCSGRRSARPARRAGRRRRAAGRGTGRRSPRCASCPRPGGPGRGRRGRCRSGRAARRTRPGRGRRPGSPRRCRTRRRPPRGRRRRAGRRTRCAWPGGPAGSARRP